MGQELKQLYKTVENRREPLRMEFESSRMGFESSRKGFESLRMEVESLRMGWCSATNGLLLTNGSVLK